MKAHTTSPGSKKRSTHFPLIIFLLFILFNHTSCLKKALENVTIYELDKSIFFTFRTGTESYTSFGSQYIDNPRTTGFQRVWAVTEADSSGSYNTVLRFQITSEIQCNPTILNACTGEFHFGNCSSSINIIKKGSDIPGTYDSLFVPSDYHMLSGYTQGKRINYIIVPQDFKCVVTKEVIQPSGQKIIEGNFSCIVYKNDIKSILYPASGNFRLNLE